MMGQKWELNGCGCNIMISRTSCRLGKQQILLLLIVWLFRSAGHPTFAGETAESSAEPLNEPSEIWCCSAAKKVASASVWAAELSSTLPFTFSQLSLFTNVGMQFETTSSFPILEFTDNYENFRRGSPLILELGASRLIEADTGYHSLEAKLIGEIEFVRGTNSQVGEDIRYFQFVPGIGLNYNHTIGSTVVSSISTSLQLPYRGHMTASDFNIDIRFNF